MANYVCNILTFINDQDKISASSIFELLKDDMNGIGSLDIGKIYDLAKKNSLSCRSETKARIIAYAPYELGSKVIRFVTANTPAIYVVELLSNIFSEWAVHYQWANEDYGANTGEQCFFTGNKIYQRKPVDYTIEAFCLSAETWTIYGL